ncbi:unnamed protein product [Ostreobium quekettii]|uniref:EF-hand domain-containing protein n=1 Tax=Ostreobium quekettii TaxID=121088 RepID=A0A8S1JGZ1_9CHLO|nr:unnamed protein product [Ostreobium quekettii]|eukprot:evm.model.scf_584.4 EVM.evm.TU.scf_584.4   scf_584:50721-55614(-)
MKRRVLQELHETTSFTAFELQSMINHWRGHGGMENDQVDRGAFRRMVTHVFGEVDEDLYDSLFTAMDEDCTGRIDLKQIICALSTIFRGQKEEMLNFWFKMYDGDHDGLLAKPEFEQMLRDVNNAGRRAQPLLLFHHRRPCGAAALRASAVTARGGNVCARARQRCLMT